MSRWRTAQPLRSDRTVHPSTCLSRLRDKAQTVPLLFFFTLCQSTSSNYPQVWRNLWNVRSERTKVPGNRQKIKGRDSLRGEGLTSSMPLGSNLQGTPAYEVLLKIAVRCLISYFLLGAPSHIWNAVQKVLNYGWVSSKVIFENYIPPACHFDNSKNPYWVCNEQSIGRIIPVWFSMLCCYA